MHQTFSYDLEEIDLHDASGFFYANAPLCRFHCEARDIRDWHCTRIEVIGRNAIAERVSSTITGLALKHTVLQLRPADCHVLADQCEEAWADAEEADAIVCNRQTGQVLEMGDYR